MFNRLHYQRKIKERNAATIEQLVSFHTLERLESKIEEVIEEDQFGFRKCKVTRDTMGLMRIMSERVLDIKEEMCLCKSL